MTYKPIRHAQSRYLLNQIYGCVGKKDPLLLQLLLQKHRRAIVHRDQNVIPHSLPAKPCTVDFRQGIPKAGIVLYKHSGELVSKYKGWYGCV